MRNDNLVDRLRRHAAIQPEARALRFLDGDVLASDLSYAELDTRIRAVAACLQRNAPAGERALLLFPSGVDYVVAFHACLYAGLVAVPAYPPERGRAQHAERLRGILRDAEPRLILTTTALRESVTAELPPATMVGVIAVDAVPDSAADWREASPDPSSLAFLQYTSGSTSRPKGVRVSHANLEANEIAFTTGFGMTRDDVFVSWLPLYHDMGLIGGLLQPLHLGIPAVLMAPQSFIERPRRWLEAFARFDGTVSGAPDFAYALCADRIGEAAAAELDLSGWRLAFNGAEFVRAATLERFARRFAPAGFASGAFFPCYGLAEATLFVSGSVRGEGADIRGFDPASLASGRAAESPSGSRHVALGHTPPGHDLRIMREDGTGQAQPETIGEIWVSGPSVADGYWRNVAATEAAFVRDGNVRWLRTGDLGFERDGSLYVTGRIKDMLIVRGKNLFPQDIEQAVEAGVEAVRRGRVAAFPVEIEAREGVGVAAEFSRGVTKLVPAETLRDAIAQAVVQQCGEAPAVVIILNPRGMPLTTSGKLQRSACAALWAKDGGLDSVAVFVGGRRRGADVRVAKIAPLPGLEMIVAEVWCAVLGLDTIERGDDFFLLGGNSIAAAEAASSLREHCQIDLELGAFFAHPTLAGFAAHVAGLPRSGAGAIPPIAPVMRHEPLPLSHAQARLWFLWQMDPASTAYTVAASIRLTGTLDVDAVLRALDGVVSRHETLRTTFAAEEGGAVQIVHAARGIPVAREDLSHLHASPRAEALETLTQEALAVPFDLTSGPLLRASLIRLGADDHALLLTAHHIVIDGMSMRVLLDDLAAYYAGVTLPPLAIHYADYAAWQRDWLAEGEGARQLAFWRGELGQEHPVPALPLDRPRPAEQSHRGDSLALLIAPPLSDRLRAFAAAERASVFMVLYAAYALLLHRYTGQDDIRIGVPTANRRLRPLENLIGFFVNTLVLRSAIDAGESFVAFVARTKATVVAALAHQDLPFERLVDALQPERSLGRNPLFQAKFNYMTEPRGFDSVAGLDAQVRIVDLAGAHFDLALDILDGPQGMKVTFNYATDLFDRSTIERIAAQFGDFLAQVVEAPERALCTFRVSEANRQEIPGEAVDFPARTFLDLFRRSIVDRPDAAALVDAGGWLSYAELDARSDRVAAALLKQGIGAETPVGLLIERSNAFVVGLLGAMKAGAAAVPLDPSWPDGRLHAVLNDAEIGLLLSAGASMPTAAGTGRTVFDIAAIDPCTAPAILPALDPRQTAYIVYTSGSTGRPKGVTIPHAALANYVQSILVRLAPEPSWSMAMVSTVAADLGHTVLFGALGCGATLHLVPHKDAFDAERFAARMRGQAIDVLKIVPSHLNGLLRAETSGDVLPRRVLVLGGEALDPALVGEIRRLRPSLRIVNHYGPTETTVGVLSHAVDLMDAAIPLGLPLPNLRAHILDGSLDVVPSGVGGELYIGGAGLARGYRAAPGLTAERFVPDPFGPPGSRLYRTGDRARCDAQARVHFLGRADDQIKLRGYRIEPGEIARALLAQGGVHEAVVLAQPVAPDDARHQLVAYVTALAGERPAAAALKERLAASLPDYMVPAHILLMDGLPLTTNGKVDRKALPLPEAVETGQRRDAPEGAVEQAMAEVWAQVLRLDGVGVTDNFFELGGDSILSLQVIARLRKRGIKLTPKQIFDRQTIRSLAAIAGTVAPKPPAPHTVVDLPIQAVRLLPIQDRFFADVAVERHHWNQALLLAPRERLDADPLARALEAVVEHHEALRLRFREGPSGWGAIPGPAEVRPDLLRCERVPDEAAATAQCAKVQASLDLASGRMVQALLMEHRDASQRLLIAIHHLAVDGVSWRVLLDDIATAYGQAKAGETLALGARTESYAVWAERLHALSAGGTLASELPFWLDQGGECAGPLPYDRDPQAPELLEDSDTVVMRLDADLTARLLTQAPGAYRTQVNDLLLAALVRAVGRWSGRDSILIELEGHGREDIFPEADISRTVGWFTTVFPLRLDGATAETGHLIGKVKERLRALPNRGLGFGLLGRFGTGAQRAAIAELPEPQITFNYLGQFDTSFGADTLFVPAEGDAGPSRSLKAPLTRALVIDGEVREGCLRLSWRYGRRRHDRATVERLAADYADVLRAIVDHCTGGASGLTPSDLPLSGLDQGGLDALLAQTGLDPRGIEDVYPLSPTQQGILFHALQDGEGRRTYLNQIAVTVSGIDPERLKGAWEAATRRHAVLRTSIHWRGLEGAGLQVVHRDPPLPFVIEGRSGADIAAVERSEREAGFVLDVAPLQRVRLIRLGDGADGRTQHRLIWTSHHVLVDGWSSARLMAEVLGGEDAALPSGRYRDFIAWLGTRDRAAAEAFWRAQLGPLEEPTRLASAFHDEGRSEAGQGTRCIDFAGGASATLQAFARRERITLNTLVQGAWALMLRRLTGHAAVAFGATVAGRPAELPGAQDMLGLFITTLPIVDRAPPDEAVGPWLRALQDRNLATREHEHMPLHTIQRLAGRPGQPLFDTIVVFENYPVDEALKAPTFTDLRHASVTNYPLTLSAFAAADRLDLRLDHDLSQVSTAQAGLLADLLAGLLGALAADAERPLGAIPLGAGFGLRTGSAAPTDFEPVQCVVARRARAQPMAEALRCGTERLSYAELDARAGRLARALAGRGVGPGAVVGVAMPRTPALVVALLAVLKTGAAYTPLDPAAPPKRLVQALTDAGAALLLAEPDLRARLSEAACPVVVAGELERSVQPGDDPDVAVHPEALAYVIHTSGSTGTPKGVAVAHGPFAMHCRATADVYEMGPATRELLFLSFAFDAAHERLWTALSVGAGIVLRDDALWSPERTLAILAEERCTHLDLPLAYLQELAAVAERQGGAPRLDVCAFGGEAMPRAGLERAARGLAPRLLINGYGPTEAVVTPLAWKTSGLGVMDCFGPFAPIGVAVGARHAMVLDADGHPVPDGVTAELFVGGNGLAQGYLDRPSLTAERFLPDPLGAPGARMYRTGDRVARRPDGTMLYRGRADDQVKIRGHRIEPAEIEARLLSLPGVGAATAIACPGPTGLRLIAYAAPPANADTTIPLSGTALRAALAEMLPEPLVPSQVVVLERLPLTPNGKLDRRALPEPDTAHAVRHVPPRTDTEHMLAAIWKDVLGLDGVGVTDSFFDVGGDSIQAIRVVSRLRERFDRPLTPKDVFDTPTIEHLASRIDGLAAGSQGTAARLDALLSTFEDA